MFADRVVVRCEKGHVEFESCNRLQLTPNRNRLEKERNFVRG